MSEYHIRLSGCDATTDIVLNLDDEQIEVFRKIANRLNKRSYYDCMPTIEVREATAQDIEDDNEAIAEMAERQVEQ